MEWREEDFLGIFHHSHYLLGEGEFIGRDTTRPPYYESDNRSDSTVCQAFYRLKQLFRPCCNDYNTVPIVESSEILACISHKERNTSLYRVGRVENTRKT